jgi:hypothetical protein
MFVEISTEGDLILINSIESEVFTIGLYLMLAATVGAAVVVGLKELSIRGQDFEIKDVRDKVSGLSVLVKELDE